MADFVWALDQLKQGAKVEREAWFTPWSKVQQYMWFVYPDVEYEGAQKKPVLMFLYSGMLRGEDLVAEDWRLHI